MSRTLFKNFSLYAIGQFLTQLLSIIMLPLYLRYLNVEDYGIVASMMAAATFFNAIMQMGAGPTIMRFYYDFGDDPEGFKSFFSSVLCFNLIANIVLVAILLIFQDAFFGFILPGVNIDKYVLYVVLYSFLFAFPVLNLALFRVESKPLKFLYFNLFQFALTFLCIFYLVVLSEKGALGKIQGEFYARIPLFVIGFFLFKKYLNPKGVSLHHIKSFLKYGFPLMLQALLWWALYKMDYFLINRYLGNEGVGVFNVGFQLSYILITVGISFSLAWTPYFFSIAKKKSTAKFYGRIVPHFLVLLIVLGTCILIFVKDVLIFMDAQEYFLVLSFLPFLIVGGIFQSGYYMIQQLLLFTKKTKYVPILLGTGLVLTFISEFVGLQIAQLDGLSMAKAAGFVLIFLSTLLFGMKYYKIYFERRKVLFALLMASFNAFFIFYMDLMESGNFPPKSLLIVLNVIAIVFFGYFSKEEKKEIGYLLRNR
ncbi:lipopolysaccharide biosynthesis protein [Flagellimonas pelagia]|uniref:Oligosaccharide flippase family protein n=1 Tax=Flagellimonas pelagia TaxID=2306998 RepID=A0A3A1NHQ9_9FLAO|nr:oligosaccharide flippase family protein [Allomuricauda maritima]RIV44612.1 hypothetical protein D2V05_09670 [Allomuricauda maritima]TXJ94674.1 oligosaccharide flippase family protein [Allomuricauda maritima]